MLFEYDKSLDAKKPFRRSMMNNNALCLSSKELSEPTCKHRICMPTWRSFAKMAFQCGRYEAQDVLVDSDDIDLISLEPGNNFQVREKWQRRLLWKDVSRKLVFMNPGLLPIRLSKQYELFVVVCGTWWDLLYTNAIEGWKENCATSVIWIDELWSTMIPRYKHWLHALKQFDHIFLGMKGTVDAVSNAIGRQCHYVPYGVDAIRFCPYPDPQPRVIDVYSMGRRWDAIHQRLLKLAAEKAIFYIYDTLQSGESLAPHHRQHRDLLANIAKRSRYFMVAPGKIDVPEETQGQIEVGARYFEGAAAGTVMIGQAPNCEQFRSMFDWPDAVVEIPTDGSGMANLLSNLAAQPERLREISRRNVIETLLRHDWVYRWKQILNLAGLPLTPSMVAREKRLKQLAEMAQNDNGE
jgi:hypothetical protein